MDILLGIQYYGLEHCIGILNIWDHSNLRADIHVILDNHHIDR